MTTTPISASRIERIARCPYSETLPHVDQLPSEAAARGTAVHLFLEHVQFAINGGQTLEVARHRALVDFMDSPWRETLEQIKVHQVEWRVGVSPELAAAYSPATGRARQLSDGTRRKYNVTPDEIPGTYDAVQMDAQCPEVTDYKTGSVAPARDNMQIQLGCVTAAALCGADRARGRILRILPDGAIEPDEYEFDALELRAIRDRMGAALLAREDARAGRSNPLPVEGEHCRFCPGWRSCAAKRQTLQMFDPAASQPAITANNAAAVYRRVRDVEQAVKAIKGALAEFADLEPLEVRPGWLYGRREVDRKELRADVVFSEVAKLWGREAGVVAADLTTTTSAAIDRAIKQVAKDQLGYPSVAAAKRAVMEKIEQEGGVKTVQQVRHEEWKR